MKRVNPELFENLALNIAQLVATKQEAYGDSFGKSEHVIRLLYPDGIRSDQYQDALTVIRVIDKLFRIATQKDAFGEDPWKDIMGYSLLSVAKNEEAKELKT